MKGLLLKEYYQLKHSIKSQGFSLVLFAVLGVVMKSTVYVGMMVTILITNTVLLTMGYDEHSSWKCYAMTMPLRRRDLITVKFILLYLLTIGSVLFTALIGIPINLISDIPMIEGVVTAIGCGIFAMMSMSINIALCTKFGVEKARLMTVVSYLIPLAIIFGSFYLVDHGIVVLDSLSNGVQVAILLGLAAVVVGVTLLMWKISCNIIEGQDL